VSEIKATELNRIIAFMQFPLAVSAKHDAKRDCKTRREA